MNRIRQLIRPLDQSIGDQAVLSRAPLSTVVRDPNGHATFTPMHHEPGYAYPLIIWLHGDGGDQHQLQQVMPLISHRNYVGVAPQGTVTHTDGEVLGYGWRQTDDHIYLASQRVFDSVDDIQDQFQIAPTKVFLAGLGDGGTMAFRIAMSYPARFAGVISLGGSFPVGQAPLCRINNARDLPVLISGGRTATEYHDAQIADDLRLLHYAGMSVTLRLYPGGDGLTTNMLSDVDRWIMQQACASTCITDAPFEGDSSS